MNHLTDVKLCIANAFAELVPTACAGANDLTEALRSKLFNVFEDRVAIIAPVEHYHIIGEAFHCFGVVENNVAPHHNGLAEGFEVIDYLKCEIKIELALILARVLAVADIEGFITADIEIFAAEERNVLIDKRFYKLDACGIACVDGVVKHKVMPGVFGGLEAVELAKVLILVAFEQTEEMAERGKRGNEIDEVIIAILIDLEDLFGGHITESLINTLVFIESKGVFDIELIGIMLIISKKIDHLENAVDIGNTAAGCIVIESAVAHIGLIFDLAAFDILAAGFKHLAESLDAVEGARKGIAGDNDAVFACRELISFAALFAEAVDNDFALGIRCSENLGDNGIDTGFFINICGELLSSLEDTVIALEGKNDIEARCCDYALRFFKLFGLRKDIHSFLLIGVFLHSYPFYHTEKQMSI